MVGALHSICLPHPRTVEPTNYPIHATMAIAWNYVPSVSLQMLSKQTDGPVGGSFLAE